jgi:hypothetical protein
MTRARDVADTQENLGGGVPPFVAGKNAIINGDFFVNQRGFTSNTTAGTFNFDRFYQINSGGSFTLTPQTFTPGAAPVSGYEGKTFLQAITSSQSAAGDYAAIVQNIESVRNFAGQTATLSFWAKANTGTPKITVELAQSFGTGGSPSAAVFIYAGQITLSTSWARYSVTVAVPSISGKTLGTNNNDYLQVVLWTSAGSTFNARTGSLGIQNFTAQIWGVQMEVGNVATPFTTASGSIAGELALCQRYCYVVQGNATNASSLGTGYWNGTTNVVGFLSSKSQMRTTPTLIFSQASDLEALLIGISWNAVSAVSLSAEANAYTSQFNVTTTGGVSGQAANIRLKALSTAYVGLVAEL